MDQNSTNTSTTPPKKGGSFKRSVIWLAVLGLIGGSSYVAYQQGALDTYLPNMLKAKEEIATVAPIQSPSASAEANAQDKTALTTPAATPNDLQAALLKQMQQQNAPAASQNTATPTTPNTSTTTPLLLAINGAPANALLTAYDAQWQWSNVRDEFVQRADATLALQNLQNLKSQLESANDPAFAPTLTALAQTETQLKAWTSVPSATYLTALQQSIAAVDKLNVATKEEATPVMANLSWWERIIASLKNVVEIKKIDSAKEAQMLNPASAALVKQSISARLLSAQWAAQTGQWALAQSNAAEAKHLATQWADPTALTPLQALIDNTAFPAAPDFSAVSTALQQARAQLTSAARAQQSAPAPATTPANTPAAAPAKSSTPSEKGGA